MGENETGKKKLNPKYLEKIKSLTLLDDGFFSICFADDTECAELVLRILLDKDDLKVTSVKTQYRMKNLRGHDIILDAFATDSEGVRYNVEIQRSSHGAVPKRARYYSSMIDANILSSGDDYTLLTETYVIFITEKDVLGKGLPIYHIDRTIAETDDAFDDGSHIVYVNASVVDDSRLGRLMHDFKCAIPDDMKYAVLADKTFER